MSEIQKPLKSIDVREICLKNNLEFPDSQWELLEEWAVLLLESNQQVNLISRKKKEYLWEKQILPCLSLLIFRKIEKDADVCDFGTGGGLPGMILAIVRPDLHLTLLDSRQKKIIILQKMIEKLRLKNVHTVTGRGEEIGKQLLWRQKFPCVTVRSVAPLVDLVHWTADLRKPDSVLHIFKGGDIRDEMNALTKGIMGVEVKKSLMTLKGYPNFAMDQKYLISLEFTSI